MIESLKRNYGLAAWIRQETAFGEVLMEDTHREFVAFCQRTMLGE